MGQEPPVTGNDCWWRFDVRVEYPFSLHDDECRVDHNSTPRIVVVPRRGVVVHRSAKSCVIGRQYTYADCSISDVQKLSEEDPTFKWLTEAAHRPPSGCNDRVYFGSASSKWKPTVQKAWESFRIRSFRKLVHRTREYNEAALVCRALGSGDATTTSLFPFHSGL